jgi:acetyl esterase/lipase
MHRNIIVVILAAVTALGALPATGQENKQAKPSEKTAVRPKQVAAPSFDRFLERQDRNKDGEVSKDEFKGPEKWFKGMDRDGDGAVTRAEYTAAVERLKKAAQQRGGGRKLPAGVKATRDVEYAKVDGQSLKLDLYIPAKSEAKPPLLVWIHGGGWTKGSKNGVNGSMLRLSGDGYAVASLDYRLTGLQSHPKQIHDCKGAIRWLRANAEKYGYDATRIGVGGGSAGGHLVLLLGTSGGVKELEGTVGGNPKQSSKVQAVLDLFGPSDMTLFGKRNKRFGEGKAADMLRSVSPVTYITKDDPPLLIFQGDKDPLVPQEQSEHMHKLYQKAGLDSSLHIIKGAAHGGPKFTDATRSALIKKFFDKHIKE